MSRPLAAAAAALLLGGLLSACSDDQALPLPGRPDESNVDVATPELQRQKERLGVEECRPGPGEPVEGGLPELVLPCFGGGTDVDLSTLRGPLVVNFWAGWCGPCREEMPALQEFHETYGDTVPVLGIDYADTVPGVAMDLVEETGVTYPLLADPGAELGAGTTVRVVGLPHFLLLDEEGRIAHQSPGGVDSAEELVGMVEEHLGVDL